MGHYWGPGTEKWGPFIGVLWVIIGAKGSEKWGPFMESLLGARIRKVGSHIWGHFWGPEMKEPFTAPFWTARGRMVWSLNS